MASDVMYSLGALADVLCSEVRGNEKRQVYGINPWGVFSNDRITLVSSPELMALVPPEVPILAESKIFPDGRDGLAVKVYRPATAQLLKLFERLHDYGVGVSSQASVAKSASVAPSAYVGPFCVVGENSVVGENVVLIANVYIGNNVVVGDGTKINPMAVIYDNVRMGKDCLIHSAAVIGADGFGIIPGGPYGKNVKVPQIGAVVIGDDVEVGANSSIDRGAIGDTVIGDGVKMDNLVQIGHNCSIGRNCIISSQSGVAGSVILEDGVIMAVRSGTKDHVRIGKGAMLAALAAVTKDVAPGKMVSGFPATDHKEDFRFKAQLRRVPDLLKRVKKLESLVKELLGNEPQDAEEKCKD